MSTPPSAQVDEGVGCRTLLSTTAVFVVFAAAAVTIGLSFVLGDDPSPVAEHLGLTLYAAGAPVSGLFAALAGDLPLTLYLDVIVWVLVGWVVTRAVERGRRITRLVAAVLGAALVYGVAVATLLERAP